MAGRASAGLSFCLSAELTHSLEYVAFPAIRISAFQIILG